MLKFIIKALAASAGVLTICYVVDLKKKNKEIKKGNEILINGYIDLYETCWEYIKNTDKDDKKS